MLTSYSRFNLGYHTWLQVFIGSLIGILITFYRNNMIYIFNLNQILCISIFYKPPQYFLIK